MESGRSFFSAIVIILCASGSVAAQEQSYWEQFKNIVKETFSRPAPQKPEQKPEGKPAQQQPTPKTSPIYPYEQEVIKEQLYITLLKCLTEEKYQGARLNCLQEKSMANLMEWPSVQKIVKLKNLFDALPVASSDFKRGKDFLIPSVKKLKDTFVGPDQKGGIKGDIELIKTAIETAKNAKAEVTKTGIIDAEGVNLAVVNKALEASTSLKTGLQDLISLDYKTLLANVSYTLLGVGLILKGIKDTLVKGNDIFDNATGKQLVLMFNNIEIILQNVGRIIVPLTNIQPSDISPITTRNVLHIIKNSSNIPKTIPLLVNSGESIVKNIKNIEQDAKQIETKIKGIIDTIDSKNQFQKLQAELLSPISLKLKDIKLPQFEFSLNPLEWIKQANQAWLASQPLINLAFESPQLIKNQINTTLTKPMNGIIDLAKKIMEEAKYLLMDITDIYAGFKTNLDVEILPLPYVEALARISGALINLDALVKQLSASSLIQ